jgi:predicted deacylase
MSDLTGYPSPEERDAVSARLAGSGGGEVVRLGESVEGRPILAVRLPAPRPGAPRVLCAANLHGLEYAGVHVAQAFLEAAAGGALAALREQAEVWVAPSLNPDGYARTWERGGEGGLAALRTNSRGVDLNRNFPLPGGARPSRLPGAGAGRPGAATFRGPTPLSEPETRALEGLLGGVSFHALASLHSTMGTFIPARVTDRPAFAAYRALWRSFAAAQRVRYRPLHHRVLDVFTGELEDHAHHHHRTWAACVEVYPLWVDVLPRLRARTLFWRFNPSRPEVWAANDVPALEAYFLAALAMPRPGTGNRAPT